MRVRRLTSRLGLALLIVAFMAAPAGADDDRRVEQLEQDVATLKAAVAELRTEAVVPEERLVELERKIDVLASELETLRVGTASPAPTATTTGPPGLAPAASKVYRSTGGVSVGGYGEWLYERFDDSRDDGSDAGATDTFDALRAILYFGYKFDEKWVFNSEFEFEHASTGADGEASVEFAYLDWLYRPELSFRAGLLLVPMGFVNELHEPTTFLGATRPETERRIIPTTWRENGVGVHGEAGGFAYRSYVLNGFDGADFSAGGLRGGRQKGSKAKAEDLAWVGRLDWVAVPGLTLGLSAYVGDSGQDLETPDGRSLGLSTTIWEAHAEWRSRGWELRGLIARADLDDVAELNQVLGLEGAASVGDTLEGAYLQVGYDVLAGRGRRSLTPYLRWEQLDTQESVPDGYTASDATDREILTLGLAFRPIDQVILKADWQDVDNEAGTGVDRVNVALGYIF